MKEKQIYPKDNLGIELVNGQPARNKKQQQDLPCWTLAAFKGAENLVDDAWAWVNNQLPASNNTLAPADPSRDPGRPDDAARYL
ncbi:hypothetical protein PG995_015812 [Apiospora arundinis]